MANQVEIVIRGRNDLRQVTDEIERDLQEVEDALRDVERTADRGMNRAEREMLGFGRETDRARRHVRDLDRDVNQLAATITRRLVAAIAAVQFTRMARDAVEAGVVLNSFFEQTSIGFTTMLGSGEKADRMLRDMIDFAKRTPFEIRGVTENAQRLLAYGFAAERVLPILRQVGDASAALGLGQQGIDRITLALGQMQAKQMISGEEMRQLAEAGIAAWEMVAHAIGVSVPEAMKLAENRALDFDVAFQGILDGMEQRFGGMMEGFRSTSQGAWNEIKESAQLALAEGLEPFSEELREVLIELRDNVPVIAALIETAAETAANSLQPVLDIISAINRNLEWLTESMGGAEGVRQMADFLENIDSVTPIARLPLEGAAFFFDFIARFAENIEKNRARMDEMLEEEAGRITAKLETELQSGIAEMDLEAALREAFSFTPIPSQLGGARSDPFFTLLAHMGIGDLVSPSLAPPFPTAPDQTAASAALVRAAFATAVAHGRFGSDIETERARLEMERGLLVIERNLLDERRELVEDILALPQVDTVEDRQTVLAVLGDINEQLAITELAIRDVDRALAESRLFDVPAFGAQLAGGVRRHVPGSFFPVTTPIPQVVPPTAVPAELIAAINARMPFEPEEMTPPPEVEEFLTSLDLIRLAFDELGDNLTRVGGAVEVVVRTLWKNVSIGDDWAISFSPQGLLVSAVTMGAQLIVDAFMRVDEAALEFAANLERIRMADPGTDDLSVAMAFQDYYNIAANRRLAEQQASEVRRIQQQIQGTHGLGGFFRYGFGQAQARAEFQRDLADARKALDEIISRIEGAYTGLVNALGISADHFAGTIAGAFDAHVFEDPLLAAADTFVGRLDTGINQMLRRAFIQEFIASELSGEIEAMRNEVFAQILAGAPDLEALERFRTDIDDKAEPFFELINSLLPLIDATNDVTRGMRGMALTLADLDRGFRNAPANFDLARLLAESRRQQPVVLVVRDRQEAKRTLRDMGYDVTGSTAAALASY